MPVGSTLGAPTFQPLDDFGVVLPGGFLDVYAAGTTTRIDTFTDEALTVANDNPVELDAFGRATIFLTPGTAYKFVLKDADGATIWTFARYTALGAGGGSSGGGSHLNNFRITLESNNPVSTTDQTGKTTVYATPIDGRDIELFDAAGTPTTYTSDQFSIAVPATTNQMYDLFVYANAGVPTLEALAWTNDTTRATALVRTTTGALTKSGDLTRLFVASFRTTGVAGQTEDSVLNRLLSNYYHRRPRPLRVNDTTDSWTYTTATMRQANGAAANKVAIVVCVPEYDLQLECRHTWSNATACYVQIGIGEGSTTTVHASCVGGVSGNGAGSSGLYQQMTASLKISPAVGYQYYAWLEGSAAAGTTTWYGDATFVQAAKFHSGLHGAVWG